MTPLHWACKKNYIDIVDMLLKFKSEVDSIDIVSLNAINLTKILNSDWQDAPNFSHLK